jgi:hypothetical protein
MVRLQMNDEFKKFWKEAVKVMPWHLPRGNEINHKTPVGIAGILT